MRPRLSLLALVAVCLMMAGCASTKSNFYGYPKYFYAYNDKFLKQLNTLIFYQNQPCSYNSAGAAQTPGSAGSTAYPSTTSIAHEECVGLCQEYLDCVCGNCNEPITKTNPDGTETTITPKTCDKTKCRNKIIGELIVFIDLQYNQFRADLYFSNVSTGFVSDLAGIGLGTAGALSPTIAAKNTLAVLTAGISGARVSYSKEVMFDQTMPAYINQMDNDRKKMMDAFKTNTALPYDKYPLSQALTDVNAYFLAGTLPGAIYSLTNNAASKTATASPQTLMDKIKALQDQVKGYQATSKITIIKALVPSIIVPTKEQIAEINKKQKANGLPVVAINADGTVNGNCDFTKLSEDQTTNFLNDVLLLIPNDDAYSKASKVCTDNAPKTSPSASQAGGGQQ